MIDDAREHEAEDRRRRELADARNSAETLVYQTEKVLQRLGRQGPANERQNIEAPLNALRDAAGRMTTTAIKRQHDELQNAFHALSQQLYAQQAQSASQPRASTPVGTGIVAVPEAGEVVEGVFREA